MGWQPSSPKLQNQVAKKTGKAFYSKACMHAQDFESHEVEALIGAQGPRDGIDVAQSKRVDLGSYVDGRFSGLASFQT